MPPNLFFLPISVSWLMAPIYSQSHKLDTHISSTHSLNLHQSNATSFNPFPVTSLPSPHSKWMAKKV